MPTISASCFDNVSAAQKALYYTPMITRRDALAQAASAAHGPERPQKSPEICFLTATELVRRMHRKDLSAREVLDAHLRQIDRINPQVNAIVTLVADQARDHAAKADQAAARNESLGPLHGLPIAHKDLHETKGIRTTFGSPIFKDHEI